VAVTARQRRDFPRRALGESLARGLAQMAEQMAELAPATAAATLALPETTREALLDYLDELHKWNRVYNLTAVREPREMVARHLLDSLSLLPFLAGDSLLDVGSGAGLPGVPLALARADLRVDLLDASAKRTRFLTHLRSRLPLENVRVLRSRVEDWRPAAENRGDDGRGDGRVCGYAMITSRAFSDLRQFTAMSRHLLANGGCWLAMLGRAPSSAALQNLAADLALVELRRVALPGEAAARHIARVVPRTSGDSG